MMMMMEEEEEENQQPKENEEGGEGKMLMDQNSACFQATLQNIPFIWWSQGNLMKRRRKVETKQTTRSEKR